MEAKDVVNLAVEQKVYLYLDAGKLKFKAKDQGMDDDLKKLLKKHKENIIELLIRSESMTKKNNHQRLEIIPRGNTVASLSFAQHRLWFIDQLEKGSAEYNMPAALRVQGEFDVKSAEQAISRIINRHQPLRTVFSQQEQVPVQIINKDFNFVLPVVDLSELDKEEQELKVHQMLSEDCQKSFDLSQDLMIRASYLLLSAVPSHEQGVLLFNMHHIASDGWSMGILVKEFMTQYQAVHNGLPDPLPPLLIQYADYAHWQKECLAAGMLESQLTYWKKQLEQLPVVHALPLDFPRHQTKTYQGGIITGQLKEETSQALKLLAKEQQVTLFMLIHAALSLVLSRHSNTDDIVIGTPVANRMQAELEPLIGVFINTLVLRTSTQHRGFIDYLQHVRQVNLDAQENQDVSFDQLVELCQVSRSMQHSPLFQIMFSMNTNEGSELTLPGLRFSPIESDEIVAKFDLTVNAEVSENEIKLVWTYDNALFKQATINRLNDHLQRLLSGIALAPSTDIQALPMLSAHELDEQVNIINATETDYPQEQLIHQLFAAQALKTPKKTALVCGENRLNYLELARRASRLANYLQVQGIGEGSRVALLLSAGCEFMVGILGILKCGATYVPLLVNQGVGRIQQIFEDANIALVLTDTRLHEQLPDSEVIRVMMDEAIKPTWLSNYQEPRKMPKIGLDTPAYIIYTSGSTGSAKGVEILHRGMLDYCLYASQKYYDNVDGSVVATLAAFDITLPSLYLPLINGGYVALPGDKDSLTYLWSQLRIANTERWLLRLTPMHVEGLLVLQANEIRLQAHVFVIGGEAFSAQTAKALQNCYPNSQIYNHYGPTETVVGCTIFDVSANLSGLTDSIPIGRPMANTSVYVLDRNACLLPSGAIGELYIGGAGVAKGYVNLPELNQQKFVDNPFSRPSSPRLYRSGDIVRWNDSGQLEFIQRLDEQIKVRGFRVELGDIQAQINQIHNVDSALVIVKTVADSQQLVAYIRPEPVMFSDLEKGSDISAGYISAIRASLRESLPEYMIPVAFILVEKWPLTLSGKIDRKALPEPQIHSLTDEFIAPDTANEKLLVVIWAHLLKLDEDKISTHVSFFDLGGHSLLSVRLVSEIRQQFAVELAVKTIFNAATINALAVSIEAASGKVLRQTIKPIRQSGHEFSMSFAQQRLWFIDQLQGGSPEYNMPMAYQVSGILDLTLLSRVFNTIIARHQILRTGYIEKEGHTLQHVHSMEEVNFKLVEYDIRHLEEQQQVLESKQLLASDVSEMFDLSSGVMLRVSYIKQREAKGILLFNMHHIASDGWSMQVLSKEFFTLYHAYVKGLENPLPALKVQYVDYAYWQREYLEGEAFSSQINYWKKQLDQLPSVHGLQLKQSRANIKGHEGAVVSSVLSADIAKQLLTLARQYQLTPFMLLHGVLSLLLSRYSNSSDIVIATPVANRLQTELEPLIGFFVNTLVLRADTNHQSLSEYFAHIRQVHLDAQENQDIPFEQLVEILKTPRSTSHTPLFQIMLTTNTDYGLNSLQDREKFTLPDIEMQAMEADHVQAKFDLDINIRINEQGVELHWVYDKALFSESYISQLNDHLSCLLSRVTTSAKDSHCKLSDLGMLSQGEINHLTYELNNTHADYPRDKCFHELFEQQAEKHPDSIAVVFEDKRLTYRQLNEKSNQLAHFLIEHHNVKANTMLGLCVERSLEMVICLLGILKSGGSYFPLDLEHGSQVLNERILNSDLIVTVYSDMTESQIQLDACAGLNINEFYRLAGNKYKVTNGSFSFSSESLAYVMSSSGTTGKPKLIGLPHRALTNLIFGMIAGNNALSGTHSVLQFSSVGFDMSFTEIALALLQGGSIHVISESTRHNVRELITIIENNDISLLNLPYSMLTVFADICQQQALVFPSLEAVISTADKLEINDAIKQFFLINNKTQLINHFGPTETHVCTTYNLSQSPEKWHKHVPIGKPIANSQCYILAVEQSLTPKGCIGELYVAGDCLAVGYIDNPQMTTEKFQQINIPGVGVRKLYKTGDLVKWQDDNLVYAGRSDDQKKINGYRIELNLIEQQLKTHPEVNNATVLHNEKSDMIIGYYLSDSFLSEAELRDFLLSKMPSYMVPRKLIQRDNFSLTVNGKIDKCALADVDLGTEENQGSKPETEIEMKLADIWASLLGISVDDIYVGSNFFALGGTSIMLIKVLHLIQKQFSLNIQVDKLYLHQYISSLSHFISEEVLMKEISNIDGEESQWEI